MAPVGFEPTFSGLWAQRDDLASPRCVEDLEQRPAAGFGPATSAISARAALTALYLLSYAGMLQGGCCEVEPSRAAPLAVTAGYAAGIALGAIASRCVKAGPCTDSASGRHRSSSMTPVAQRVVAEGLDQCTQVADGRKE